MSSIGAMFAPHHQDVADELVRVCRPGGTIALLSWTPEGMIGALFRTMGPFAPPPPPGASAAAAMGQRGPPARACSATASSGARSSATTSRSTAFEHPREYGEHFKDLYGPTIVGPANAVKNGQEAEFDEAVNNFSDEWNRGTEDDARFEQEYLVVGRHQGLRRSGAARGRRRAAAGLSRAHFAILSEPEMTSPSSVTSTGTMFWPLSLAHLAARRVEGVAEDAEAVDLLDLGVPAGVPQAPRGRFGTDGRPGAASGTFPSTRRASLPGP